MQNLEERRGRRAMQDGVQARCDALFLLTDKGACDTIRMTKGAALGIATVCEERVAFHEKAISRFYLWILIEKKTFICIIAWFGGFYGLFCRAFVL